MQNPHRKPLLLLVVVYTSVLLLLAPRVEGNGRFGRHQEEPQVFRAYFQARQQVYALATRREPWAVDYEAGYLVLDADAAEAERLRQAGFRLEVDLARTWALARPHMKVPGQIAGIPGYSCYRTVEETFAAAAGLAATYPDLASWVDVGDSWEKTEGQDSGYDIQVLRLTNMAVTGPKPGLFVMSSLHAREYAPAELNLRFAEYLLANYGTDATATWLLDSRTIHLLFQANPDGRKYAEAGFLWRKNVNEAYCHPDSADRGADLNRNFPFQWGCCAGSSGDACSPLYRGPAPASEPETAAVIAYLKSHFPDQRPPDLTAAAPVTATGVFLDLHSFGEWVVWPWGFTFDPAPNGQALTTLGRRLAFFNDYYPSQAAALYPTDGTTDDFAYGELGLAAFTLEVGGDFFQDCATFEGKIWPDNLPALLYAAVAAGRPYEAPAGPLIQTPEVQLVSGTTVVTLTATANDGDYSNRNGVEPIQDIAAARFFLDIPPWLPAASPQTLGAADGAFDSSVEEVRTSLDAGVLAAGRHTLYLQAQDVNGNWGAVRALFLDVPLKMETISYLPVLHKVGSRFELTPLSD